ncbi:MAG TPA: YceI family protein [Phycisphaerales bacterium]|nr:YceI family protein [Phycisphaerales bacterium]
MKSLALVVSALALFSAAGLAIAQPAEKGQERRQERSRQSSAPTQEFPKSLPVPAETAKKGTVYYCITAKERQITLHSDAPVEQIDGYSINVVGYAVAGPKDSPAKLQAGEWHLPVASIDTGNRMRNKHLTEAGWLDAAKFPNIIFKLSEVKDIGEAKTDETTGATSYECTLVGDMTLHGITKQMTIPGAKIAFRKGDETTAREAAGDLMLVSCKFKIKLSDFGVSNKVVGQKVAEDIELTTKLVHTTVEPSKGEEKPKDAAKPDEKKDEKKPVQSGS